MNHSTFFREVADRIECDTVRAEALSLAVFEELRSINPKVNVVLSSGFAEQTKIASMLAQGLRGFIPKPYSREKLLEQVRSTLDAAR